MLLIKIRPRPSFSLIVSLTLALVTWIIFYPGIMSVDSLFTYREAITGNITDIRSPFITILLLLFLKAGGKISLFILLQCILGYLGIRRLVFAVTGLFSPRQERQEWLTVFVLLIISSPLTPMAIYFVTFWLDTWLGILLAWVFALILEIAQESTRNISKPRSTKLFFLLLLITFVMLTRLNSPILYPTLILVVSSLLWDSMVSRKMVLVLALCPFVLYLLFNLLQYNVFGVKRAHQVRTVFAVDLASMLSYNQSICQNLPLQSCHIVQEKFSPDFVVGKGAIDHTLNQNLGNSDPGFIELLSSPYLVSEIRLAVTNYPLTYGLVKVLNFLDYIQSRDQNYFQSYIHPNGFNIYFNPQFEHVRTKLIITLHKVYQHPILRFFSFVHFPWILVNILGILSCNVISQKSHQLKMFGLVLLTPAMYSFSYILALPSAEFRYMYPSTLLIQVMSITIFTYLISKLFINHIWDDIPRRQNTDPIRNV